MAAVATKKPGGSLGVQLTFPRTFSRFYDASARISSYFPLQQSAPMDIMTGDTFQNNYHSQKRADANQSVMNGIQNKLSAERKLLTGIHNYHLPKPVLGQRVYANPSVGASEYQSARRDNSAPAAPFKVVDVETERIAMTGGAMTGGAVTREGRDFYNARLQNRIEELDRMNALAVGYTVPSGQPFSVSDNTRRGDQVKVDFFTYMRSLQDSILQGDYSKFTFENLKDTLKLLFQFAPTATREDFNDILPPLDLMLYSIREATSDEPEFVTGASDIVFTETLLVFLESMRQYVVNMIENVYSSPEDRQTLSRSLIKSLGFMNFMTKENDRQLLAKAALGNQRVNQAIQNINSTFDPSLGMDNGRFTNIQRTREDTEQDGVPRAPFAGLGDPNQEAFGRDRGKFQGVAFFGEAVTQQPSGIVAPLPFAGVDQITTAEPVDGIELKNAVDDVVENLLEGVGGGDIQTAINNKYPNPEVFVNQVADDLGRRGFTSAEIARGMEQTPIQAFAGYIAKNKGDIAPARIQQAERTTAQPTIMYQPQFTSSAINIPPGFPETRQKLLEDYTTVAKLKELAARLPPEFGRYKPQDGSVVRSVQKRLIEIIRNKIPNY